MPWIPNALILRGDVLDGLATLPDASVNCVVTSPPYWGLRDYGADGQIGLENTLDEHIAKMVAVFSEVRRVLASDGVMWLNYGDAYSGKSLLGMPWRVAFALQADGWYLRSDVIWAKPNPMPESCTDRPTKSHEYVFLMTKSPKYWYDADAVREEHVEPERSNGRIENRGHRHNALGGVRPREYNPNGKNIRSVWTIPTEAMPDAHFATFPQKLAHRCILSGCPEGGIVLDPFAGSGTTLWVATKNNREAIGIELNPEYAEIARKRMAGDMFATVEVKDAERARQTAG